MHPTRPLLPHLNRSIIPCPAPQGGLKYAGADVDAMRAVAKAYQDRSLQAFQAALQSYSEQLGGDVIVHAHLSALYDTLLEQNLIRWGMGTLCAHGLCLCKLFDRLLCAAWQTAVHHAMPCHAMPCHAMPCPYHAMPCHAGPSTSRHAMLPPASLHRTG
jgi:hypothetical protein